MDSEKKEPDYERCLSDLSEKQMNKVVHVIKKHFPDVKIELDDCDMPKRNLKLYFSEGSFTTEIKSKIQDIIQYSKIIEQ